MLTCPHCGQKAMSSLRKIFLGPAVSVRCQHCRKNVSVPWSSALLILPTSMLISSQVIIQPALWIMVSFTSLVLVLFFFLFVRWIPLVEG
jgi:hypothetical protein